MLWLLLPAALAGDVSLYARTLAYVDGFYLHPEAVNRERMFEDAGRQAERSIEWLLVDIDGRLLTLRDGQGTWEAEVRLERPGALPEALGRLEDALRSAPHPLPPDMDVRVELLRGVARSLDRHSVVLADANLERFDERLSGTMTGVGISCGVQDGSLVVTDVLAGSPAERGGVLRGDRVTRVDGRSTIGMVAGDIGALLRGQAGTTVSMQVKRIGEEALVELRLQRAEVHLPNVFVDRATGDVGVVRIDHFSEQTHDWLYRCLEEIRSSPVSSLVLDLRGNTGGSLLQSADAADAFLQFGRIVTTVGPDGGPVTGLTESFDAGPDNPPQALPLAVLLDHATASGSEILAGSLQHLGRALIFGTNSFGKGTVQKVYPLAAGIKFKLTVAEYRLAQDARVLDVGVHPDVLFYTYRFDEDGVWFPDPALELRHAPEGTVILPLTEEYAGWRGSPVPTRDGSLEAALGLIASAEGASREKLLAGLALIAPSLEESFDERLHEVFGVRGMDWSARPAHVPAGVVGGSGVLTAELGRTGDGAQVDTVDVGSAVTLRVSVRNDGAPLWRACVRLRSLNGVWDDRVLPLGKVPAGTSRTGETSLTIPLAAADRADVVELWLEADGVPATRIGERVLSVRGDPPLELGASLRARTDRAGRMTVDVALTDLGEARDRSGRELRLRFAWPDIEGVELEAPSQVSVELPNRGTAHAGLVFLLGEDAPEILPVTLLVETATGQDVASWPLMLARDGTARVQPPTLSLRELSKVQPPGMALLQIRATDDEAVHHALVYAGTERVDRTRYEPETIWDSRKVSWMNAEKDKKRLDKTVAVPVYPGENRYLITVTDSAGLRTDRVIYLLGQTPEAAAEVEGG